MTLGLIFGTIAIWVLYDVWTGLKRGAQTTISVQSYNLAVQYPIFPFLIGVVMGHLFWTQ